MIKINLYSRTPISFTIQFQTLIFCDFCEQGERSRCSQNSGKIWCTCNTLVKLCIISSFLTLSGYLVLPVSEHLIYLCSNSFRITYVFFYIFAFYIGSFFLLFRWFKFTLKPPYRIAIGNFFSAIWDTSHWNFLVKFGLKTA